jgi:hypothetical protein
MRNVSTLTVTTLLIAASIAVTMSTPTRVRALGNAVALGTTDLEQGSETPKKKVTIVRRVNRATASASLIEKIRSSEVANSMVSIRRRTVRPRTGVSMYLLSNLGFLVIKGGNTTTPKAVEGDLYLNPDGSWTFKGCLCVNKLGQGDDCTIRDASTKTCNQEEMCCGWAEITLGP